jgi:murein DD-endopeptidase MepM/ murein hydrolase activator NlpD
VARHRSPEGRRAHLEPPLSAAPAAAGVGGAYRTIAYQAPRLAWTPASSLTTPTSGPPSAFSLLTSSLPVRLVATAIAGSAVAATGQHLLVQAVPTASDGAAALRAGVDGLFGTAPRPAGSADVVGGPITATAATAALVTAPAGALTPTGADPVVVDAAGLVKAADLQRTAAEDAARAAQEQAAARANPAIARAQDSAAAEARAAAGDGVQLVVGRFSSPFGQRTGEFHEGVDIAAPIGTPIHVPLDGTVIDSGPASGFGLWVRVKHDDGTITTYGHINQSFVKVGEQVKAGEIIAETGNRGHSTGPHLHFEVTTPAGTKIDPQPWMREFGVTI